MNNPTKPKFKKGDRVTYEGLGPDATATVDAVHFVRGRAEPEYTLKIERGADCATRWRLEGTLTLKRPLMRKSISATMPKRKLKLAENRQKDREMRAKIANTIKAVKVL